MKRKKTMLSKPLMVIAMGVLLSAFGIIYLKDLNRRMFIQFHSLQQAQQTDQVEWGKLLLEESTWSTQSRIQQVAEVRLKMYIPEQKDVVVVGSSQKMLAAK